MNNAGRIGFLIKGEYEETAVYDFLDVVFYGGASYVAKKLTTGNAPSRNNEYWQVLAEGGSLTTDGDASDTTVVFDEAENRANVNSGNRMSEIMGKIRKWFSDLSDGATSTLLGSNLPEEKVLVSDAAGKVAASDLASDTLGYLSGLTGDVQGQFDRRPNAFKSSLTIPVTSGWLKIAKLPREAMIRSDIPDSETLTISFSCTPTTDAGDYEQACKLVITKTWEGAKVRVLNSTHVKAAIVTQIRKVHDETEEAYYLELEVNVPSCPCKMDLSFESGTIPWEAMKSIQFDTGGGVKVYSASIGIDDLHYVLDRMNRYGDYIWTTSAEIPGVLYVDIDTPDSYYNRKMTLYQEAGNSESWYLSVPKKLEGQTMLVFRDVLYGSPNHVMVVLTEAHPVPGRIWTNFYNTNDWSGWKCTVPQDGDNILWNDGSIRFADNASFNLRRTIAGYSHVRITYYVQTNISIKPEQAWNTAVVPVVNGNVVRCMLEGTQYLYHVFLGLEIVNSTLYTTFGRRFNLSNSMLEESYGDQAFVTKIEGVNL